MRLFVTSLLQRTRLAVRVAVIVCPYLIVVGIRPTHGPSLRAEEPKPRSTLRGHTGAIWSVAFSPDGETLASAGSDHTIKVWDVATGKERTELLGHTGYVWSVAFSPDGKTLASAGSDETVKLWDVTAGKERATLHGHHNRITSVAFSPDGKTLASASRDQTVKLWDVAAGKERTSFQGHTESVVAVAFSPDGTTLASASEDKTIKLWEVSSGHLQASLLGHTGYVQTVAFSPDGGTLASASSDKTVKLWKMTNGRERATLRGHTEGVVSVFYSPDGKTLASASYDNTVKLWEVATCEERATLKGRTFVLPCVAYSPDGKTLASASENKTVKIWEVAAATKAESDRSSVVVPEDLEALWTTLVGADAVQAYQALGTLVVAGDQAVSVAKRRVRPVPKPTPQEIARLMNELDSNDFAVREKATEELEQMGEQAEDALRKKVRQQPSLEVRRRIDQLLSKLERATPESIRALRAVEVLEHIGSSDAKKVLETLAAGDEEARLTEEAKASLARLKKWTVAEK